MKKVVRFDESFEIETKKLLVWNFIVYNYIIMKVVPFDESL